MASTASDLIKFEKQATGENADTWGTKANTAMSRIEEAIAGYTAITMVGANYTLDDTQYQENATTTAESHLAFIKVNGTPGASYKVVIPLRTKEYMIWNNVTTYDITVGGATGDTVTIPNGKIAKVWCDGTNVEFSSPAIDSAGVIAQVIGKQTIWIPAGAMRPTVSNPCATITDVETTAGRPDMQVLDFDSTADEGAQFAVMFPKAWDLGTVTYRVAWTTTATGTTGIAMGLQGVAVGDGDTIDVAYGTAVVVTDDGQSTAEDFYLTAESAAVTIAGSPAADQLCYFRLYRDVSDANDDMTEDARIIGVKMIFSVTAGNDE